MVQIQGWDRDDEGGEAGLEGIHRVGGVHSSINTSPLISSNLWGRTHTLHNINVYLLWGCDALVYLLYALTCLDANVALVSAYLI